MTCRCCDRNCSLLAGYHNPQGRVLALLRLVHLAADDLALVLPRELIAPLAGRLSKFILRAKVRLADESGAWRVTPAVPASDSTSAPPAHALPRNRAARSRAWGRPSPCASARRRRAGS